ncbi:MAG: hypothetical protein N4A44_04130 [Alphaproteobacteria bacterium]|jgi:hypothetical protein|nr:hypothetical protein [Alphaproteobacteria bacterium]
MLKIKFQKEVSDRLFMETLEDGIIIKLQNSNNPEFFKTDFALMVPLKTFKSFNSNGEEILPEDRILLNGWKHSKDDKFMGVYHLDGIAEIEIYFDEGDFTLLDEEFHGRYPWHKLGFFSRRIIDSIKKE